MTQLVSQEEVILNEEYPLTKIPEAIMEVEPTLGLEMGSPQQS